MKEMSRNEIIAISVSVVIVAIVLLIGILNTVLNNAAPESRAVVERNMEQNHESGLVVEDIVIGEGVEAVAGAVITAHYTGTLDDGTVFDSSVTRGAPFSFTLGVGQVIRGWDLGITGMKVGGKRELTIPADLAYGDRAIGAIPAGSVLHFEVELLGVETQ